MNLTGLDISEHVSAPDADALHNLILAVQRPKMVAINVGTWKGHSASVLGEVVKPQGGHVFCIDHWKGAEATQNRAEAEKRNIFELFLLNMAKLDLMTVICPVMEDSVTAASYFQDGVADLIFIDADHMHPSIKADLKAWWPKVRTGGTMCGHDCQGRYLDLTEGQRLAVDQSLDKEFTGGMHCGVIKALHEWSPDHHVVPGTLIWYRSKT